VALYRRPLTIPKDYLRNPDAAIRKWGKPALEAWLTITEPKYRAASDYPPDWLWRRFVTLLRDKKKCRHCTSDGEKAYRKKRRRMENKPRWNPLGGLDVHHVVPVTKGGDHSLENLITLCGECHSFEHPRSGLFKGIRPRRRPAKPNSTIDVRCEGCGAINRIPSIRAEEQARCGRCKAVLSRPVDYGDRNVSTRMRHSWLEFSVERLG
jgi:hypothetical protein